MKSETAIVIAGIAMVSLGLVLFYSIQNTSDLDPVFRSIRHGGTFMGLMGIGVTMAGLLMFLMNRNKPTVQERVDLDP